MFLILSFVCLAFFVWFVIQIRSLVLPILFSDTDTKRKVVLCMRSWFNSQFKQIFYHSTNK